jgi:hypothetical protein
VRPIAALAGKRPGLPMLITTTRACTGRDAPYPRAQSDQASMQTCSGGIPLGPCPNPAGRDRSGPVQAGLSGLGLVERKANQAMGHDRCAGRHSPLPPLPSGLRWQTWPPLEWRGMASSHAVMCSIFLREFVHATSPNPINMSSLSSQLRRKRIADFDMWLARRTCDSHVTRDSQMTCDSRAGFVNKTKTCEWRSDSAPEFSPAVRAIQTHG